MTSLNFSLVIGIVLLTCSSQTAWSQIKTADGPLEFVKTIAQKSGQSISDSVFKYEVLTGLSTKDISPECDPKIFEDKMLAKRLSLADYFSKVRSYFNDCNSELTKKSALGGVNSLLKASLYEYSFLQHPQVQKISIKLPSGRQVPAIFALKSDPRPRPLVVVKCGVFCTADETASMKENMMSFFDQSPFNVVLLANQTGADHIALNHIFSIGGATEGLEVLEVGQWLKEKWEYRDRISSLHLMGLSLGGNAAVFGAAYNEMYPQMDGAKTYSSVIALCPVISLRPTLDKLYQSPIVGDVFAKMTRDQLQLSRKNLNDVPDLLVSSNVPGNKMNMPDFLGLLNATSLQRRGVASTSESYFKKNNFWNLDHKVSTPLLVWASDDDIVVNNKINAKVLENDPFYERSPVVGAVNLPYGSHCSFSAAYGLLAYTEVMKIFVLTNSPEFVDYNQVQQMPWRFGFDKMYSVEEHVGQEWKFTANSNKVKLIFRVFNYTGPQCSETGPWGGNDQCIRYREYNLPISALKNMGARVPRNKTEAEAISREFNAHVQFRTKDQKPLNGTNATEFNMIWRSAMN